MRTRSKWPNGADPWRVWSLRPQLRALPPIETEQTTTTERQPSERVASIAGKVLNGYEPEPAEVKSLAASVLSQRVS